MTSLSQSELVPPQYCHVPPRYEPIPPQYTLIPSLYRLLCDAEMQDPHKFQAGLFLRRKHLIDAENHLRHLFITNPFICDEYTGLIKVFEAPALLRTFMPRIVKRRIDLDAQYVMPLEQSKRGVLGNPCVVSSIGEFVDQWTAFTGGILRELHRWPGVLAAGGAVLLSLLPLSIEEKRFILSHYLKQKADIDLFFVGMSAALVSSVP
jgi:hypothetical protein